MKVHHALAALIAVTLFAPLSSVAADKTAAKAAKPVAAAKGVKCGSGYIAAGKMCTKTTAAAAPAPAAKAVDKAAAKTAAAAATTASAAAKTAAAASKSTTATKVAMAKPTGKGVKCGNSYIAAGKTCRK